MNIRILPLKERRIYKKIRLDCDLTFDRLDLGDTRLQLLSPDDPESLAGQDGEMGTDEFPVWVHPWDATVLLSFFLKERSVLQKGKLLDIGIGPAAPGFAAASVGYNVTVVREKKHILDFQRVSGAASRAQGIRYKLLDMSRPPAFTRYDIIAGAELLFGPDKVGEIFDFCEASLKKDGEIIFAHDIRRQGLASFLARAEQRFEVEFKEQQMTREGKTSVVVINRLRRKK